MLRKTLLSLFFYSIMWSLSGQAYQPLVLEDAHWKICQTSAEEAWSCGTLFEYNLGADTVVGNVDYHKLYRRSFLPNGESGGGLGAYDLPLRIVSETLVGLIREDLSGRKVFWRDVSSLLCPDAPNSEFLLYDFALSVGDTLAGCALGSMDTVVVTAVNLEDIYGTERRVFQLSTGFELIEGIGYTSGLLELPIPSVSTLSTSLLDYCRAPDMDCNVAIQKGMINPYQEWHISESINYFSGGFTRITFEYRFRNPIQIDGHIYFNLEERQQATQPTWQETGYRFREANGKVYRTSPIEPDAEELLLYDFSLTELGDTFSLSTLVLGEANMQLVLVDTITLNNGEQRRRVHWSPGYPLNQNWYWIEGFGANDHPFFPYYTFINDLDGERRKLQCFYSEPDLDTPLWQNDIFTGCYDYLVANEDVQATKISIFPNPTRTSLTLEGGILGDSYELYDVHGKQVKRTVVSATSAITVNLENLPSGIYVYRLLSTDGNLRKTGKIIKRE
ncbi:T9SS type A sorting domain-containing protein [Lewinella cohaerens]|uniref:T9SS type A sorting domain-containing protein n=1 Tax=Lewinella cohaerens TaxID=70995 RepID=UPI0003A065C2|nr:T9SS type A sorting domain-containing protein [Lewinella cohaerens]